MEGGNLTKIKEKLVEFHSFFGCFLGQAKGLIFYINEEMILATVISIHQYHIWAKMDGTN